MSCKHGCKSMGRLNMHNLRPTCMVLIYLLYNLLQFLLVEMMSNHERFMSIQIHNSEIHILYQQYLVVKLSEMNFKNKSFSPISEYRNWRILQLFR